LAPKLFPSRTPTSQERAVAINGPPRVRAWSNDGQDWSKYAPIVQ
jgi:hypothetical protein